MPRKFQPLTVNSDGAVMAHYAKYHKDAVYYVYHEIGGDARLADEAHKDAKWFYEKIWMKVRPKELEISATPGVEDLLRKLDAGEHAQVIEGTVSRADE